MKTSDFDRAFDDNKNVTGALDMKNASRPGRAQRRVNVDFPAWMVDSLDKEAGRLGITRQSLIKCWLAERLDN